MSEMPHGLEPELDDYEALPDSSPIFAHMGAGALAGIMEHTVMYPLDCVKTRMQCLCPNPRANYSGVGDAVYRIVRFEGLRTTVRGIGAVTGGAGPAHAMYFACYEKLKKEFSQTIPSPQLAQGLAGGVATVLHDAVMNPADAVKQRMQVFGSPYRNSLQCARQVYASEGMSAFYRSYSTQLTMNIPFQVIHFIAYESMQDWLNKNRNYDPFSHCASGAAAGAVAAAVTTPLDVCKTLLNTQEQCLLVPEQERLTVRGFLHAVRTVYQIQGMRGYLRGLTPRILFQMPGTAISWSVYEFFKHTLLKKEPDVMSSSSVQLLGSVQARPGARPGDSRSEQCAPSEQS